MGTHNDYFAAVYIIRALMEHELFFKLYFIYLYNQSSIKTLFDKSMPSKTETQDRSFCLRRDWCRDMQWLHVYRLQTFLENPVGK